MTEREDWKVGSALMMYVESDGNWYNGRVKLVEGKGKKEWLTVKYAKGEKKFKRDSKDLKVDYFPDIEEDIFEEPKQDDKKKRKSKKKNKKLKKDRSSKDAQKQKDAKLAKKVSTNLKKAQEKKESEEEEEDVMD